MKDFETFRPVEKKLYPRTPADAMFGDLQKIQEAPDGENFVGLARHEPKGEEIQTELPRVVEPAEQSLRTEADIAAHLAALTVPDEVWKKYSPRD